MSKILLCICLLATAACSHSRYRDRPWEDPYTYFQMRRARCLLLAGGESDRERLWCRAHGGVAYEVLPVTRDTAPYWEPRPGPYAPIG